jgi:hypothetical protein
LRVAVAIDSSPGLTGFDIILLTDHTVLTPAGISLSGTVLLGGTPVIFAECLSGQLKTGSQCNPRDTVDTIELAAASASGSPPTGPPTTGLLFTAIYNVTGSSANIPIGFQTGCSGTSTSGSVCITVSSPFGNVPQTAQSAKFTDQKYFDIQGYLLNNPNGPVGSITSPQRTTDTSLGINVTSINDFNGNVTLTVTWSSSLLNFSASVSPKVAWVNNTNPSSVFFSTPIAVTFQVGLNAPPGPYLVNFTGTSGSLTPNTLSIRFMIPPPDFSIVPTPSSVTFNVTSVGIATITLSGLGNFTGIVNLSVTHPTGLNVSLTNSQLTIPPKGGSVSTTLQANSTITATYSVNVTATGGTIAHTITVIFAALDFTMSALYPLGSSVLTIPQSQNATEKINFQTVVPGNVTVTIGKPSINAINSNPSPSSGISATCSPTKLKVQTTGGSTFNINFTLCVVVGSIPGNYTVTVPATSSVVTHTVTFLVQVLGPDFAIAPANSILTLPLGNSTSINVSLISKLSFTGRLTQIQAVFASDSNCPAPPTVSFGFSTASLNLTNPTVIDPLSIVATPAAQKGICSLSVSATFSSLKRSATIIVIVTTTTSPHNLEVYSVTATPDSTTVGTNVDITITVMNLGTVPENSTIVGLSGIIDVGEANFTNLAPGANVTKVIHWRTSGFAAGTYTIGGQVLPVKGQTNTQNSIVRLATPVTLTAANTSVLQSPYLEPAIIGALIVLVAVVAFLFLQSRRKRPAQ